MSNTIFAGLLGWLLLTILTFSLSISAVEEDLVNRSNIKIQTEGYEGVKLTGSGRDITLSGDMQNGTDPLSLLNLVSNVYGVRTIVNETRLTTIQENVSVDDRTKGVDLLHQALVNAESESLKSGDEQAEEPNSLTQSPDEKTQNKNLIPADDISIAAVTNTALPPADPTTNSKIQPANGACDLLNAEIMFPQVIYFDSAQFDLDHSKRQKLVMVSQFAQRCKQYKFDIIGHSDNRGDNVYNLELSKKRAEELKNKLIALSVNGFSLTDMGIGSRIPVSSNTTDEGRAENRRVEIKIARQGNTL